MVILSKKEHRGLMERLERLEVNGDAQAKKIKELEYRVNLLELLPKREKDAQRIFDEWINGEKQVAKT